MAEVLLPPLEQAGVFGNIYVGQVERVLPDIRGAFVRIDKNRTCFYDLSEQEQAIYVGRSDDHGGRQVNGPYHLKAGDR